MANMTPAELSLGLTSVCASTLSQLAMKAAARTHKQAGKWLLLMLAIGLQLTSVLLVIVLLRTLPLSMLVVFAALAYLTVPVLCAALFKERLTLRFWLGAGLVCAGVVLASLH
ncbi:hypothetical protein JY471_05655 [Stenotrophomonas maltophilia]|nr:hypothetical protein [Stenotrophomonas maltophilia]